MKLKIQALSMAVLLATAALVGCNKSDKAAAGGAAGQQMPPTVVDVQTVQLGSVPVIKTLSGRVTAAETSEVRPQVSGIIEAVLFKEGSYVRAGQELYRLNRDNYVSAANTSIAAIQTAEASLISAKASLKAQEATLAQARADLSRVEGLVKIDAVSKQLYDQYVTAVRTASANVEAARANVNQANAAIASAKASRDASQLDMSRTIVRAPISGKISISAVTAGALVSANQTTPLATISRSDVVYVDIRQSSSDLLRLRQQMASGASSAGSAQVQIVLEDGSVYPMTGQLALSDASVDKDTGAVTLRAIFPNPDGVLIPGMYVNANLAQSVVNNAVLLPQSAITRTPKGETQVYVVGKDKKIQVRNVTTAGSFQGQWVVTGGLQNGENVVVVGGSKVAVDQVVETKPYTPSANTSGAQNQAAANSAKGAATQEAATQEESQSPKGPIAEPERPAAENRQAENTVSEEDQAAMDMADAPDQTGSQPAKSSAK